MSIMTPNYGAPKAGRLATGAFGTTPIAGNLWRRAAVNRVDPAHVGGIVQPGVGQNRTSSTVHGNPLANNYNTATQVPLPAMTPVNRFMVSKRGHLPSPTGTIPLIQPHEKGSVLKNKIIPPAKRQFGAGTEGTADTPFHRNPPAVQPAPLPITARAGERTAAQSFHSYGNNWYQANNSFISGATNTATGRTGTGRWNTIKRGAAE